MEDKELQELFAAKRTVEANHRRQQKLTAAIGATRQKRTLWPIWAGAAAAAVAAVLLLAQPTNDIETSIPTVQVAQYNVAIVEKIPTRGPEDSPSFIRKYEPKESSITISEESPLSEEITPIVAIDEPSAADTSAPTSKTIHRRRATRLVQQEAPRRESIFQLLAERISIDTSDNPFYKNINIKTSTI
jgi:hypothetical protein